MNNSEKAVCNSLFKFEVSTSVNLDRWKGAVVRLLITTYADNKHLFGGKAKNKNAFEKIVEQFTKVSGRLVKRQRGACERMGLVTNGTHSSETEIPKTNFPKCFLNGKRPPSPGWILSQRITVPFSDTRTLKFKVQPTNAFLATVNHNS